MEKNIWEKTKESFITAAIAAILVLIVILLIWIPFKIIPKIYMNGSSYVASSLTSTFIPAANNNTTISSDAPTNDTNTSAINNTNTSVSTNNTVEISNYVEKPDLAIRLVGTGIIDRSTRQFIKTNTIGSNDEAGIRFEVVNIGNTPSGSWSFNATLPSNVTPSYNSDTQVSIGRGEGIQFTLGFDNPSTNNAYISVSSSNNSETNSNNNSLIIPININGVTNNIATNYNNNDKNYGTINGNGYQYIYGQNYNPGYNNSGTSDYNYGTSYSWTSLAGTCTANSHAVYAGSPVTWTVNATGGNGYYSYSWTGTDNLYSNEKSPAKTYYTSGLKTATVNITSNGVTISKQCNVNILADNNYYNNNYTSSDLSVSLSGVGIISSNGQFYETSQIARGSTVALKVNVTNLGTNYTGAWGLVASLSPSKSGYAYKIDDQSSIAPGATAQIIITFYNPQTIGINNVFVQVDQNNLTNDSNRNNNTLNSTVNIY